MDAIIYLVGLVGLVGLVVVLMPILTPRGRPQLF